MKPVNAIELKRSYIIFGVSFIVLAAFSILCLFLFFGAQRYERQLLLQRAERADQLLAKRRDINTQFDLIISRLNDLSRFTQINPEEMDNQAIMLQNVQDAVFRVNEILKQQQLQTPSFRLYQKMADDVSQMAGIQDSLFTTRFQLESMKAQLDACLRVNRSAGDKLSLGLFRH
jgi:hypothetical protein